MEISSFKVMPRWISYRVHQPNTRSTWPGVQRCTGRPLFFRTFNSRLHRYSSVQIPLTDSACNKIKAEGWAQHKGAFLFFRLFSQITGSTTPF